MACFWILRCVNCFGDSLTWRNLNLPYWVLLLHKVFNITLLRNRISVHLLLDFLSNAPQKIIVHEFVCLYRSNSIRSLLTFYWDFFIFVPTLFDSWLLIRLSRSDELFVVTTIPSRPLFWIIIKHAGVDSSYF